ncbi:hypothetical protein [Streptomyces sp. NPDC048248]|uniref:hypothetical protein n=1 Tax=Streptomyces sp. NPDC048248 TaxID=3365523 RepID=UPI0037145F30
MAHKITVPVHRARRALASAIAWGAGGERRSAQLHSVRHRSGRTGPADLDLALASVLASAVADAARVAAVPAADGRPDEVAAEPRTRGRAAANRRRAAARW